MVKKRTVEEDDHSTGLSNDEIRMNSLKILKKKHGAGYVYRFIKEERETIIEEAGGKSYENTYVTITWYCEKVQVQKMYQGRSYNERNNTSQKVAHLQSEIEKVCDDLVKFDKMTFQKSSDIMRSMRTAIKSVHGRNESWGELVEAMQLQLDSLNEELLPKKKTK